MELALQSWPGTTAPGAATETKHAVTAQSGRQPKSLLINQGEKEGPTAPAARGNSKSPHMTRGKCVHHRDLQTPPPDRRVAHPRPRPPSKLSSRIGGRSKRETADTQLTCGSQGGPAPGKRGRCSNPAVGPQTASPAASKRGQFLYAYGRESGRANTCVGRFFEGGGGKGAKGLGKAGGCDWTGVEARRGGNISRSRVIMQLHERTVPRAASPTSGGQPGARYAPRARWL